MEKYHYVDSSKIGTIEGRTAGDFLDVSIARNLKKIQADNNMAMLIENEGRDFYLIPRMETEKNIIRKENRSYGKTKSSINGRVVLDIYYLVCTNYEAEK